MSEYLTVKTVYRDEALLRQAIENVCREYVVTPELHPAGQEQCLVGYQGDKREQTAQFIVRRRQLGFSSNDLGWTRQADGTYRLIISEYDQGYEEKSQRITADVDVEYQRLFITRQVEQNPRLRGSRVVANRDARTGAVQIQIQNIRV